MTLPLTRATYLVISTVMSQDLNLETMDNCATWYNKGVEEGLKHAAPSPRTLDKIQDLSDKMTQHIIKQKEHEVNVTGKLETILSHFEEGGMVADIKAQAIRTNGRVTKLEMWKYGLGMAITLLGTFISLAIIDYVNFRKEQISEHAKEASWYENINNNLEKIAK